jgi:NAD+ synthase (glutamine-hydrolysing)
MTKTLRIALAQLNPVVGDIAGNLSLHINAAIHARDTLKADIIVFPELGLTGYPPEDLLLRPSFLNETHIAVQTFMDQVKDIHCLISHPHTVDHKTYNASSLIYNGKVLSRYAKQYLPNYGVFDEKRYFDKGNTPSVTVINGIPVGVVICEDLWEEPPVHQAVSLGARIILSPNASPFETNKYERRVETFAKRAKANNVPIVYVNQVGAQDGLVFDGGSMVLDAEGHVAQCAGFFKEHIHLCEMEVSSTHITVPKQTFHLPNLAEKTYDALVLGLRDYVEKNKFKGVLIGLSGGIDSALTAAIAVDALGKDRVHTVFMPSQYSANISFEDAALTAKNLQISFESIAIKSLYDEFIKQLTPVFNNKKLDVTEENIQARIRAVLLMAISNKFGYLVLTTGNRSELAVGYCTIYGDMAGGYAPINDVFKTSVYDLARYRNSLSAVIPERTITRAPTAELAPNQKDQDSLPPYEVLDKILMLYLNEGLGIQQIIEHGFDADIVQRIVTLVHRNEYKRAQAAIGTHIQHKSFGKDWRYPLTNGFKG